MIALLHEKPTWTTENGFRGFLVTTEQVHKDHIVYLNCYKSIRVYKKKISQLLNRAEQIEEKNSGESSRLCEGLKISVISKEQSWIDEVGDRVSGIQW